MRCRPAPALRTSTSRVRTFHAGLPLQAAGRGGGTAAAVAGSGECRGLGATAQQLDAVPGAQLLHRAAGHLPAPIAAQHSYYHATYPGASYDLIVGDGEEVLGRLYVDRGETVWLVIDLALLPGRRGKGLGTHLLSEVLAEAAAAAKPVQIHVEQFNPARHLYDRLGFHQIDDQGVYLLLERQPGEVNLGATVPIQTPPIQTPLHSA
jgi:GNAT superfamily N-acetyltransferase